MKEKHSIKAWPSIGKYRTWGWQCGRCDTGGWTKDWATAWTALDNHIHLGHMKHSLKGMFSKFTRTEK